MTAKEWLGEYQLGIDIWTNKYCHEGESFEQWLDRVSNNVEVVRKLILEKKFIFGGRTLTNYNTGNGASTSNCYSAGYAPDDTEGLLNLVPRMGLTYKAQGGQGISLSKIRPKGAPVSNGRFETDGIEPFMEIYNAVTAGISQGGSRKGALMMSLDAWHPQILDFIKIKAGTGRIKKANLSVEINNDFMEFLRFSEDTFCQFPYGKEQKFDYFTNPRETLRTMAECAWDWSEPGAIFTDRFRNYNLMQYCDDYEIVTGNPCGEQPLPANGACNLGTLNLAEFVINPYELAEFDVGAFKHAVGVSIRALDEVLDYGMQYHALSEQRAMAEKYRNIGLGISGLGDMFFRMQFIYGGDHSIQVIDNIMYEMFREAVKTSVSLAYEKGSFPGYSESIWEADIMKKHFSSSEIASMKAIGLRNCSLLSIAPTGSIGTMLNLTTGIEPAYRLSYQRKTESLHKDQDVYYDVEIKSVEDYRKLHPEGPLPEYFVSADQIDWRDRVKMQAAIQQHVDTAISSTVNLPNSATVEDIMNLYVEAWKAGIKGITVHRSGNKMEGILTGKDERKQESEVKAEESEVTTKEFDRDDVTGLNRQIQSGCGSLHVSAFFHNQTHKLHKLYLDKGSEGGCNEFMTGLSRMISLAAKEGIPIEKIIDQLDSTGACSSYTVRRATKKDTSPGSCCPMAVGRALGDMWGQYQREHQNGVATPKENPNGTQPPGWPTIPLNKTLATMGCCPECGVALAFEGKCFTCKNCGWTKCE